MSKIIVAGSINMDIITRVAALPQTGESIAGKSVEYLPGGKGLNQAVACAKMGAETILVSRLGNDVFAAALTDFIKQHHIGTAYLKTSAKESGTAFITVDDEGQNTIVVVPGSNADVGIEDISEIPISKGDIIICQFEIPLPTVTALFRRAKQTGARTILNPSPIQAIPKELLKLTDVLIINETELGFIKGENLDDDTTVETIARVADKTKSRPEQIVIVTLGRHGALVVEDTAYQIHGHPVQAIDTVGAGDCFAGVIASQLLLGKCVRDCVTTANKAASVCVTRKGAAPSMPMAHEIF